MSTGFHETIQTWGIAKFAEFISAPCWSIVLREFQLHLVLELSMERIHSNCGNVCVIIGAAIATRDYSYAGPARFLEGEDKGNN